MTNKTEEQQRSAFEAWYAEYLQKVSADSGGYQWPATRRAWDAWEAGRAALQSQDRELCFWTHDEETCAYDTTCGNAFIVGEGTPAENGMKFCCYCGGVLIEAIDHARRIEENK